jgi:hypothetical protein
MSVGIMDADLATYTLVPFNLEAMKLSSYYKKKGEIVVLSPSFTPERNTKFFYRKDYNDGDFPLNLLTTPNVEYGGLAFSNNKYFPLPLEIERMKPDTSLYESAAAAILGNMSNDRKKIYYNMMEGEHCRISLDGKTVWSEYPRQFRSLSSARNLLFHDYDLAAIDGGFETVKYILSRARNDGWATKVGMKFPVQMYDGQTLLNWSSLNSNSTFFSTRYNGVIDDDAFLEWVGSVRQRAIYTQIDYHVTSPRYEENHFIEHLLPKIFRQVIISRSYYVFFTLTYDEDFFSDKRWCDVIRLFNFYHNSYSGVPQAAYLRKISEDTLFDFASASDKIPRKYYQGKAMSKDEIRSIFRFVREKHYPLFTDFYECNAKKLGGKL